MSFEWVLTKLGDLIEIKHGFAFKGEFFSEKPTNYQLVTPANFLIGGGFQTGKNKYYSGTIPTDYILKKGDIIVTMTDLSKRADTLGYSARVPETDDVVWLHNQRIGLVKLKQNIIVDSDFLYYLLCTDGYRHWIVSSATGSTVKHTSPSRICEYEFYLPPINIQKSVGQTLSSLDNRISLLRETNTTLEAIAQTLFKSWFVDFDPVKAKAEGKQPEGMDEATAALFPSEFEESALGLIPKGWRVERLGSVIPVKDGTHESPKPTESGYPLITSRHITGGKMDFDNTYLISDVDFINISKRSRVDRFDVLITMIGTVGIPVIVLEDKTDFAIKNIGLFKTSSKLEFSHYLYLLLLSSNMKHYIEARLAGTTQKYVSLKALREIEIILPSGDILSMFSQVTFSLFDKIHENDGLIKTITTLRDTLLPRLISGQLRINQPQDVINEVGA